MLEKLPDGSIHERLKRNHISPAKNQSSPVFKAQKRPKFLLPKTPVAASEHTKPKFQQTEVHTQSAESPRPVPRFTTPKGGTAKALPTRTPPTFTHGHAHTKDDDDITESGGQEMMHNPFVVSDELEEPTLSAPKKARRFLPVQQKRTTSIASRSTVDVLNAIRFESVSAHGVTAQDTHITTADWSPHRKRGKAMDRSKFMPGGMAETVAIWIYEAQSSHGFP